VPTRIVRRSRAPTAAASVTVVVARSPCGTCAAVSCGAFAGPNQCERPRGVPVPQAGACAGKCGPVADGCGNVYACGTCAAGEICGAGGSSVCGAPDGGGGLLAAHLPSRGMRNVALSAMAAEVRLTVEAVPPDKPVAPGPQPMRSASRARVARRSPASRLARPAARWVTGAAVYSIAARVLRPTAVAAVALRTSAVTRPACQPRAPRPMRPVERSPTDVAALSIAVHAPHPSPAEGVAFRTSAAA